MNALRCQIPVGWTGRVRINPGIIYRSIAKITQAAI